MDHSLLNSVIKITQQRDIDSLEYCLVATIAEILDASEVGIYKMIDQGDAINLEETLSVNLDEQEPSGQSVVWKNQAKKICHDSNIEKCIALGKAIFISEDNQLMRLILPLTYNSKASAALNILSHKDLRKSVKMLEGIIRIYENYLYILNESERDKLTGLFNRRTFDKKLDRLLQFQRNKQLALVTDDANKGMRLLRPDSDAWLAIIDVDNFKQVNDQFGHVFGDGVLLLLAHKMKICFRETDYLFRFGGEEFVVILEPHPKEFARRTLERFREAIAEHKFPLIGHVTVSIGYAKINQTDYAPSILHSADKALYYAKEHGRNCVYNYESLVADGSVNQTQLGTAINF